MMGAPEGGQASTVIAAPPTTCQVTVVDPGREFLFVTGRPDKPDTRWR